MSHAYVMYTVLGALTGNNLFMKKIFLLWYIIMMCRSGFSQIKNIDILIGQNDIQITKYFDSLFKFKNNPYYKIEKDVADNGDMIIKAKYSITDEEYYSCLGVSVRFHRTNGNEICTQQTVYGSTKFSDLNLSFGKDHFDFISDKHWEKKYGKNIPAKVTVVFDKLETNKEIYTLIYALESTQ